MLKESAGDPDQGLNDVLPMTSARSVSVLVPRILEDMFWLGRYAERAEQMLRLVLAAHPYAEDFQQRPSSTGGQTLGVLMDAIHALAGPARGTDPRPVRRRLPLAAPRPAPGRLGRALARSGCATRCRACATSCPATRGAASAPSTGPRRRCVAQPHSHQVAESAGRMLTGILALQGVTASMMRDQGWHMIGAGRSVERSLQLCQLLAATTTVRRGIDVDREVLNAVLTASESASPTAGATAATSVPAGSSSCCFLDPDNPRSLVFCLAELRRHLAAQPASTGSTRPERLLGDLDDELERDRHRHAGRDRRRRPAQPRGLPRRDRRHADAAGRRDARAALRDRPGAAHARHDRAHRGVESRGSVGMTAYRITHRTTYSYDDEVTDSLGIAHLVPRALPWQAVASYDVAVSPAPVRPQPRHRLLRQLRDVLPGDRTAHPPGDRGGQRGRRAPRRCVPERRSRSRWEDARPLVVAEHARCLAGRRLRARVRRRSSRSRRRATYAAASFARHRPLGEAVTDLMHRIHADFEYDQTATTVTSTVGEVLATRAGVCQDFAHLTLACLRSHGLAARYVSGYLSTRPAPGKERVVGADASHAWVAVWLPDPAGPGRRVARLRPDQRPVGRRPLRHRRLGPRLLRRLAGQGRDLHRGEEVDAAGQRGRRADLIPRELAAALGAPRLASIAALRCSRALRSHGCNAASLRDDRPGSHPLRRHRRSRR